MTDRITATPSKIVAGDTISWLIIHPDYPASAGWVLSYAFINSTDKIAFSGTAEGDSHRISIASTSAYAPGEYKYHAYVTLSTVRHLVETGTITVLPNFAAESDLDTRTHAEICLANIELVLQGKATQDNMRYTIASRELWKYSWDELLRMRNHYRAEISRERRANGSGGSNKVLVRFA